MKSVNRRDESEGSSASSDRSGRAAKTGRPVYVYLLVLAVLFAVAGLAGTFYVRHQASREAEATAKQAAHFAADLAASEIATSLEEVRAQIGGVAATPNLAEVIVTPEACSLTFSGAGPFAKGHIDILDAEGTVLCSSEPSAVTRSISYAAEDWFATTREEPVDEGPIQDVLTRKPVMVTAVPNEAGVVVAAFLDLASLGPGLSADLGGPEDFEFLIVGAAGERVISRSIDPARWTGSTVPGDLWERPADAIQRIDLDGTERFYGHAAVPGVDWNVFAGAERAIALAAANDLYQDLLVLIAAGLALIFVALGIVYRRVALPITYLRHAVRAAAADPTVGLTPVTGPSEVRALGGEFAALLQDVSRELEDRKRAEGALRESERSYRLLFENNPQPMWIYDTETLFFLEVNDAACRHYGYSRGQWLGMTIRDIRPSEDVPAMLESIHDAPPLERSGPWRHVKADGSVIEVEITSHQVDFGKALGRFVMAEDVTERRRLEDQLAQSQRLEGLGQLAGGVAHDFNNLLAVIVNYSAFIAQTLERLEPSDAVKQAREDVEQISIAGARGAALTHSLLAFARKEVVHPEVLNPNDIVREVEMLLQRTIGEEIEFSTSLDTEIWRIKTDPSQLQQVILNLAVNARDAMPDGGTLTIETNNVEVDESYASTWVGLEVGRYVRIRVSDTGTGMDPEVAQHVFEPFFTTKPAGEGTGLGLATVHGIVVQAGGSVHLYTEKGVGTSLSVMLPATDQPVIESARVPVRTLSGSEAVMVVEDEDAIRELTLRILTRHGYEVILAATGPEAIELAEDQGRAIDLVITDVVMPQMLGKEFGERFGEVRPGIPLIYMSGYAQAILDSRGRLEPGKTLLEKPFSEAELLTAVREALE